MRTPRLTTGGTTRLDNGVVTHSYDHSRYTRAWKRRQGPQLVALDGTVVGYLGKGGRVWTPKEVRA